ncbi:MAG: phosphonoacetate hydrolase [Rhodospirillales bacterium]|nr:phosphonoacetate hydrolase [Alphaproteobacteria bacterium]MBL6948010.1 phosphonoacetate hydrolase [Rhodospirillales bacterium]
MTDHQPTLEVNGRSYRWPRQPLVVVCIDGSEPGYVEEAIAAGKAPFFERILAEGTNRLADCVVPSFTNPNNISIVTGVAPDTHGIAANFFYDRDADEDVMTNTPKFLWVDTIFKAFFDAGAKVAIVTAKDKLTSMLGHGLDFSSGRTLAFSSEKSDQTTLAKNGIDRADLFVGRPVPEVYSADLSEFIFAAGVKIMQRDRPDVMYLSTTDYIQHKHAPGSPVANDFYGMMDGYLAQLDGMGCLIALTADHGMNAKHTDSGEPDVIYLQDILDGWSMGSQARVVLTITDPYVVHHGALGSFCTVYLSPDDDGDALADSLAAKIRGLDGVLAVYSRSEACAKFELPEDRMGDLIVVSEKHKVLGSKAESHDLSGLTEPLRSHGGVTEQRVPLILNKPTPELTEDRRLRNFDIFDVALNYAQ